ncbi:hypothetical protein M153_3560003335 [Pseudoloma neurophilia]|uniref:Uncharacterized protein n=1 Tax=Pseudoloma neurophilia TaxID=146866 RepID=A0A0R0M718_9MICR|nr:hypothetical protein M153_3560003335 [Pseudoloma neurophilia]
MKNKKINLIEMHELDQQSISDKSLFNYSHFDKLIFNPQKILKAVIHF